MPRTDNGNCVGIGHLPEPTEQGLRSTIQNVLHNSKGLERMSGPCDPKGQRGKKDTSVTGLKVLRIH